MTPEEVNEAVARKLGYVWGDKDILGSPRPDYCHSIAAAWEIMGWLGEHDYLFTMSNDGEDPNTWLVWLESPSIHVEADTAPMAICLAYLKLENGL